MLKISTYTTSNSAKDKRIGVPFAPSQSVNISPALASPLSPFVSGVPAAEVAKDTPGSNVRFPYCILLHFQ